MPNTLTIETLIDNATSKGLCTREEYQQILDTIYQKKEPKMLVFGTGPDCLLWLAANQDGITHFIEDDPVWADRYSMFPNIHKVDYQSSQMDPHTIHSNEQLYMHLKRLEGYWDIVFVDGPLGAHAGRMKAIYNAYRIANASFRHHDPVVFVHDYDRASEKMYVDHFFKDYEIEVTGRLAKIQL